MILKFVGGAVRKEWSCFLDGYENNFDLLIKYFDYDYILLM
jgi:hypothetical protein